jgi:type II restriction enzyme
MSASSGVGVPGTIASEVEVMAKAKSPHFPVFEEFKAASYLKRYDLLCQKLIQERLYTTAALLTSPRSAAETGEFSGLSPMTDLKTFVTSLAGHIAAEAARLG